jgi:F-type H+-transporting ATPase subunit alpha
MVELLKQPQYQPMEVIDEVVAIYAASQGYMDKIPKDLVQAWEAEFLEYFNTAGKDLKAELIAKKELTPELENKLVELLKAFANVAQIGKKSPTDYKVPVDDQKKLQEQIQAAKQPAAH